MGLWRMVAVARLQRVHCCAIWELLHCSRRCRPPCMHQRQWWDAPICLMQRPLAFIIFTVDGWQNELSVHRRTSCDRFWKYVSTFNSGLLVEWIRTLPRGGMYWKIHPPRPKRFPKGGDLAPWGPRDLYDYALLPTFPANFLAPKSVSAIFSCF